MLGNPDMVNMKVSDSLTYMKRCNGHEDIEWQEASCHSDLAQANRIVRLFYHTKTVVFLIPKENLYVQFPCQIRFSVDGDAKAEIKGTQLFRPHSHSVDFHGIMGG
jgi:hypothetical protein